MCSLKLLFRQKAVEDSALSLDQNHGGRVVRFFPAGPQQVRSSIQVCSSYKPEAKRFSFCCLNVTHMTREPLLRNNLYLPQELSLEYYLSLINDMPSGTFWMSLILKFLRFVCGMGLTTIFKSWMSALSRFCFLVYVKEAFGQLNVHCKLILVIKVSY